MRGRMLSAVQDDLLRTERELLGRLAAALARFDAPDEQRAALAASMARLDDFFLLVVVGEFNAGKSAFVNALVGAPVLAEGVTPTTAQITVVRHGPAAAAEGPRGGVLSVTAPLPLLEDVHIVDTPGTNAILREHEALTNEFVPRADLVLFLTSADRPFTETERAFMASIRDWGKKVVVVINKVDILEGEAQAAQVRGFVEEHAGRLLGEVPPVFMVSARRAMRAKQGEPALWASSGFEALEAFVATTLDATGRVRLKLLSPLGVGAALAERQQAVVRDRRALLQEDFTTLDEVERQLAVYREDMQRDFGFRMADIENLLLELERRGHAYFDDTMRLARVMDLLNKSRVQHGFEQQVVADTPQRIERKVSELIDWLVAADLKQWQAVTGHLAERRRRYAGRILGDAEVGFDYDRQRLLDSVGRDAQRVVDTYDRGAEAKALADGAQVAVATAAAAGAGALGLGAAVTIAATSAAADVTGLVMASLLATIGLVVIPARRAKAKADMRAKLADVRTRLATALRQQFASEIDRSGLRIREAIGPYSRFIRAEGDKLAEADAELTAIGTGLADLRARVEAL